MSKRAPTEDEELAAEEAAEAEPKPVTPPSAWQRHDLSVLLVALAIFVAGALANRSLTSPSLIDFHEQALHFKRPAGWLPGLRPAPKQAALVDRSAGFGVQANAPEQHFHVVYTSARDARRRIEVRVQPSPTYSNLRGVLSVSRLGQYGEFYWVGESSDRSIARRDWVRTEFRYAFKASKSGSPQIASGVEYATLNDKHLYVVTVHGEPNQMSDLDDLVSSSLRVQAPTAASK